MPERQPKLPQFDTVESVQDLKTGRHYLRSRKRPRLPEPTEWERAQAMKQWWAQTGWDTFTQGAESWKQYQAAQIVQTSGQNDVEFASSEFVVFDAENNLRESFKTAQGLRIRAQDIITMFRSEAREIRTHLGSQSNWLDSYLLWILQVLSTEYNLSKRTTENLKTFITQPSLPTTSQL